MNPYNTSAFGANAYAKVGLETGVVTTDPHGLIRMLFDATLLSIGQARNAIIARDVEGKGRSISKAIKIIEEGLVVSLDHKAGNELAGNLGMLYQYMATRLLVASLKDDLSALDEVARLMGELRDAWNSIGPRAGGMAAGTAPMARAA